MPHPRFRVTAISQSSTALPLSPAIHSDPDILGGVPVFCGTRVPVKTLLDYLEAGDSLNEFLDHFPSVRREQAIAALALTKHRLIADANSVE